MMPNPGDSLDEYKGKAANIAAQFVLDGMIVGLGTGSTVHHLIENLGKKVQAGLKIKVVPTSEKSAHEAKKAGICLTNLDICPTIDLTIDGADEIEQGTLNLIKGLGGALLREKIVAMASRKLIIIADFSKSVSYLGQRSPVPIEIAPFGWATTASRLKDVGVNPKLRFKENGMPFVTDEGHYILDCSFHAPCDVRKLDQNINSVVGVVETGFFLGRTSKVIVVGPHGTEKL